MAIWECCNKLSLDPTKYEPHCKRQATWDQIDSTKAEKKRGDFLITKNGRSIMMDPNFSAAYNTAATNIWTKRHLANYNAREKRKDYTKTYRHNAKSFIPACIESDGAVCKELEDLFLS